MTADDLRIISLAIEALEAKPNYVFRGLDPTTSSKIIYMLKALQDKYDKKKVKVVQESITQQFVRMFGNVYQQCTGAPYKADKKAFIIAHILIKAHGFVPVWHKVELLAFHCRDAQVWWAKDGWASFTIETLSNRWNNILPVRRLNPEESKDKKYQDELKKWSDHDTAIGKAINGAGTSHGGNGIGTPAHSAG